MNEIQKLVQEVYESTKEDLLSMGKYEKSCNVPFHSIWFGFKLTGEPGTKGFNNDFKRILIANIRKVVPFLMEKAKDNHSYAVNLDAANATPSLDFSVDVNTGFSPNVSWHVVRLPLVDIDAEVYHYRDREWHVYDFYTQIAFF